MTHLTTVQVQSEFKFKTIGQNGVYGEDMRSLTSKTKIGATMWFPEDLEDTTDFTVSKFFEPLYFVKMGPFLSSWHSSISKTSELLLNYMIQSTQY